MFLLIFNQLLKMLIIMALAFFCYNVRIITQEGNRSISNLLLIVVNPCLIITAYQIDYDSQLVKGLLIAFVAAIASHLIGIAIAHFCIPSRNNPEYAIERLATVYSNCGFIGIPLIYSVLGNEGVFYLTAYMTIFNILTWTHGLSLLENKFSFSKLKEGVLSPSVLATLIAMILFFLQLRIPATVLDSMNYVADMNTPLAMMVAGFSVAQADLKKIFSNLRIYWVAVLKLLIIPLVVTLFLFLFQVEHDIAFTTLIACACPTATAITMMSIRYNQNYKYSSEIFSFTTLLSMITIPAVTFIAGFLIK